MSSDFKIKKNFSEYELKKRESSKVLALTDDIRNALKKIKK